MSPATQTVGGPFFDDLHVGLVADSAPALTLTEGVAAAHGAIVGDRMRLALDAELSRRVLGSRWPIRRSCGTWRTDNRRYSRNA